MVFKLTIHLFSICLLNLLMFYIKNLYGENFSKMNIVIITDGPRDRFIDRELENFPFKNETSGIKNLNDIISFLLTTATIIWGTNTSLVGWRYHMETYACANNFRTLFRHLLTSGVVPLLYLIFFKVSFKNFSYGSSGKSLPISFFRYESISAIE